jgi:hypothetical protein
VRVDARCVLVSIPALKAILLMSRFASSKTARIWAGRIALRERSNAPVALSYPGRRFALLWAISFCPFGAGTSQTYRVGSYLFEPIVPTRDSPPIASHDVSPVRTLVFAILQPFEVLAKMAQGSGMKTRASASNLVPST